MKTEWDYTDLAQAYLKRPDYADGAIDDIVSCPGIEPGAAVCDMGAGTGKLTLPLLERGMSVTAVEPNDAMRALGVTETGGHPGVTWVEGTAEQPGLPPGSFRLVTFGSSFTVSHRARALVQVNRLLCSGGWLAVLSNHRDLEDPLQKTIEAVIHQAIPGYRYGLRREDQAGAITESGLFGTVRKIEQDVSHHQEVTDIVEAWRSHGTLHRQAGDRFDDIIRRIEDLLRATGRQTISVPYTTRLWLAEVSR